MTKGITRHLASLCSLADIHMGGRRNSDAVFMELDAAFPITSISLTLIGKKKGLEAAKWLIEEAAREEGFTLDTAIKGEEGFHYLKIDTCANVQSGPSELLALVHEATGCGLDVHVEPVAHEVEWKHRGGLRNLYIPYIDVHIGHSSNPLVQETVTRYLLNHLKAHTDTLHTDTPQLHQAAKNGDVKTITMSIYDRRDRQPSKVRLTGIKAAQHIGKFLGCRVERLREECAGR